MFLNGEAVASGEAEDSKLKINFDVVVHRVSCDYLSLDAMDVSGEQHIGIEHNVYKRRLDLDGKPLEEAQRETKVGETAKITNKTVENPETKTKEVEVSVMSVFGLKNK